MHALSRRPQTNNFRSRSFRDRIRRPSKWNHQKTSTHRQRLLEAFVRSAGVGVLSEFLQMIFRKEKHFPLSKSGSRPSLSKNSRIRPWSVSSPRSSTLSVGNNDRQTNRTMNGGCVPTTYLNPFLQIGTFLFVGHFVFRVRHVLIHSISFITSGTSRIAN